MRFSKWITAGLVAFLSAIGAARAQFSLDDVMARIADTFIRPAYANFETRGAALESAVGAMCSVPSRASHETAIRAMDEAIAAWSHAEIFREGPVMQENRLERLLFYPDRKGTGLKQVQAALADEDAMVTETDKLARKSVAMQGFGALEFVLTGTDSQLLQSASGAFRCKYGHAIAANIHARAVELARAWEKGSDTDRLWNSHDANNPFFRSDREALNLVLGTLIHGLEMVHDVRIGSFLDVKDGKDKPKSAIYWRSANTIAAVGQNLTALRDLFDKSGMDGALPQDQMHVADSIRFEFRIAIEAVNALDMPVETILSDAGVRRKLVFAYDSVGHLIRRFDQEYAIASGLAAGFSFSDGD